MPKYEEKGKLFTLLVLYASANRLYIVLVGVVPMKTTVVTLAKMNRETLHRLAMHGSLSLGRLPGQQPLLLLQALTHPTRPAKIELPLSSNRQNSVWRNVLQLLV